MRFDLKNILLLAFVFVVGFGLGAAVNLPGLDTSKLNAPVKESTVSIMIDYGDGEVVTYNSVPVGVGENVFQATETLAKNNNLAFESKNYEGLGALIEKINTKKNGADNRYWQYFVNNQKPDVGAGLYVLQPGDLVEWKFAPFKAE